MCTAVQSFKQSNQQHSEQWLLVLQVSLSSHEYHWRYRLQIRYCHHELNHFSQTVCLFNMHSNHLAMVSRTHILSNGEHASNSEKTSMTDYKGQWDVSGILNKQTIQSMALMCLDALVLVQRSTEWAETTHVHWHKILTLTRSQSHVHVGRLVSEAAWQVNNAHYKTKP